MNVFSLLKSYVPFCVKDKIKVYIIYLYYKFNRKCKAFPIKYHEAADFLYKYGKTMYPSSFVLKYKNIYKKIKVFQSDSGMKYVIHNTHQLYFPENMSDICIKKMYQSLITEQDVDSPHVYEYLDFRIKKGDVLFDIGAAEGIFTLDHIEEIEHAYLFESDRNWIKALEATFHPWRDKITIIPKYVSNENTDMSISLDKFVHDINCHIDFIKMDIEGAELMALEGCRKTLSDSNVRISVCTYHKKEDEKVIGGFLESLGYRLIKSGRLIYLGSYKHSDVPFFRLGVLYAVK